MGLGPDWDPKPDRPRQPSLGVPIFPGYPHWLHTEVVVVGRIQYFNCPSLDPEFSRRFGWPATKRVEVRRRRWCVVAPCACVPRKGLQTAHCQTALPQGAQTGCEEPHICLPVCDGLLPALNHSKKKLGRSVCCLCVFCQCFDRVEEVAEKLGLKKKLRTRPWQMTLRAMGKGPPPKKISNLN